MKIDGARVPNGSHLVCDVCIIGGGVNGLLLAERLASTAADVCVLESGDEVVATAETTDTLRLESAATELEPTPLNRVRALGGTARIWNTFLLNRPAARFFRLEAVDLERRDGLPYGGWPFGLEELAPYYRRAESKLMPAFSREVQQGLERSHNLALDPRRIAVVVEGFGVAEEITTKLTKYVCDQARIRIVTKATVTAIQTNKEATEAVRVRVTSRPGHTFTVGFRTVVLACGTIENARLLLSSNALQPAGLGNGHDVVGRFFMDHQRLNAGRLIPFDPEMFDRSALFDLRAIGRQFWMGKIKLSEQLIRERRLLNSSTLLWPRPSARDDRAVDALKELVRLVRSGDFGPETRARLAEVVAARRYVFGAGAGLAWRQRTTAPTIDKGGWSHLRRNRERFEHFELVQQIEQAPDPDNRISLGAERDSFGVPIPRIHARFCRVDIESARVSQELLAEELERAGIGRVVRDERVPFPDLHQVGGIHHNLGGTRMHVDPKQGVVDANARVHGMTNVFAAGGSIFPTGGYANPTLTMAALTLRLGDHLEARLHRLRSTAVAVTDGQSP
jgi:choline dehydrogenase-like flavoprotein